MRPATSTCFITVAMCLAHVEVVRTNVVVTVLSPDQGLTSSKYCQENPSQASGYCGPTSLPGFHVEPTGTGYMTFVGDVFENKLFIGQHGVVGSDNLPDNLYAIDITTGERAWTANLSPRDARFFAPPVYHDGLVFAHDAWSPAGGHEVFAVNAQTGTVVWMTDLPAFGAPGGGVVADGKFIISAGNKQEACALDEKTGVIVWTYVMDPTNKGNGASKPAAGDGMVFFSLMSKKLKALDLATGSEKWSYDLDCMSRSGPAYHDGVVYVGDGYGCTEPRTAHVSAVNAQTGIEIWKVTLAGDIIYGADIIYKDGVVFCGMYYDGGVYALDASNGATKWFFETGRHVHGDMAVDNGVLYVGVNLNNFYAVDIATGEEKWHFTTSGDPRLGLKVHGGNVYIGTTTGHLYSLNKETGEHSVATK